MVEGGDDQGEAAARRIGQQRMETTDIPIADLIFAEYNPRQLTTEQYEQLKASLSRFGFVDPCIVNSHPKRRNIIIGGHQRVKVWKDMGNDTAPCVQVRLDADKERELNVRLNKNTGGWDWDMLANHFDVAELTEWGFSEEELQAFDVDADTSDVDAEPQIDRAEELREKWGVETGQVWACGEHRVVCGDSTKPKDVQSAMGGEHADVCLTDPPYGLGDSATSKNDYATYDDTIENLRVLIQKTVVPLIGRMRVVLTPGNKNQYEYPRPSWTMAWFCPAGVGRGPWGFCCWQPIMCYGKDAKLAVGKGSHPDALVHQEGPSSDAHPCAKPMKLWVWLADRVSNDADSIYDPFLGSGTTLIACEQLGRKCRGIEISPAYVAVTLQRWADATGGTPELVT